LFGRAIDALHEFMRPNFPPPRVEFIFEEGKGYGKGAAGSTDKKPNDDRKLTRLAISNYVSDRGGDGLTAGNYPADSIYDYKKIGSDDPDHFKVQVYDNGAKGANSVKVNLYALKPHYHQDKRGGKTYVKHDPNKYKRPTAATRKLENIICKRVPGTNYFRSPYLRLVSTEASRAKRSKQCLLLGDYWAEGPKNYEKHYIEILHQRVEAEYKLDKCPVKKCVALKEADLDSARTVQFAFHILNGTGITPAQVQATVYSWTRAALAPAHIRPIIDHIETVPEPKNMLCVANLTAATRGRHASGLRAPGMQSVMSFRVDGTKILHNPLAGDSPSTTADKIITAITSKLAGYTCRKFRHRRSDLTAVAGSVSDPYDILVFKPDGKPAVMGTTTSNDRPSGGSGGQSLSRVMNFSLNNFPVSWQPASPEQRIIRWNYNKSGAINMYVLGTPLTDGTGSFDGWSPYGSYGGWVADVGPVVYLANTGISRPFVILHEACHPLMHNVHTAAPKNDASSQDVELMDGAILTPDRHDATKHIADAPIKARYHLLDEGGIVLADGTTATAKGTITTPVRRLHTVAGSYGILKNNQEPELSSAVTDLPKS
jgi:hypothetical protein